MEKHKERQQKWAKVVAQAWTDDGFKRKLLSEPTSVLNEAGLNVPDGVKVDALENTDRLIHLVLPAKPTTGDLSADHVVTDESFSGMHLLNGIG